MWANNVRCGLRKPARSIGSSGRVDELVVVAQRRGPCLGGEDFPVLQPVEGQHGFGRGTVGKVDDGVLNCNLVVLKEDPVVDLTDRIRAGKGEHVRLGHRHTAHVGDETVVVVQKGVHGVTVTGLEGFVEGGERAHASPSLTTGKEVPPVSGGH
jgi:hypothetical protein